MRKAFTALAVVLLLLVVGQFFLAASGAFESVPKDESYKPHRALGVGIVLFAILLTIVGAVARLPGRLVGMSGLVAGLALLQMVIRVIAGAFDDAGKTSTVGALVFGLHAVNALLIAAVSVRIVRQARELSRPAVSVS